MAHFPFSQPKPGGPFSPHADPVFPRSAQAAQVASPRSTARFRSLPLRPARRSARKRASPPHLADFLTPLARTFPFLCRDPRRASAPPTRLAPLLRGPDRTTLSRKPPGQPTSALNPLKVSPPSQDHARPLARSAPHAHGIMAAIPATPKLGHTRLRSPAPPL